MKTRFCRDCAFAKPQPMHRAAFPFGASQWRYARCGHMAGLRESDEDQDVAADIAVAGKTFRDGHDPENLHFCTIMRRFPDLCGPSGRFFQEREKRLPWPLSFWTTPLGCVVFLVIEFTVLNGLIGAFWGYMMATVFARWSRG